MSLPAERCLCYSFISYRTGDYKLHYYETPTRLKFVMLTDTKTNNLRIVLQQIWANLYVEFVVKNPLSPVEHPGGVGVANELFELGLDSFIVSFERRASAGTLGLINSVDPSLPVLKHGTPSLSRSLRSQAPRGLVTWASGPMRAREALPGCLSNALNASHGRAVVAATIARLWLGYQGIP